MDIKENLEARETLSTLETSRRLGLAVRSIQLMVDRGELQAWKTPGGHRRIARDSVEQWESVHTQLLAPAGNRSRGRKARTSVSEQQVKSSSAGGLRQRVLLIEDSVHFQRLVKMLVQDAFKEVDLYIAGDGITGLTMYGQFQPNVLIVDVLLPGIDGPTLIATVRSQPEFADTKLIVVTSLDESEREPYAYALAGVPLVHKPTLAVELPGLLAQALAGSEH